MKQEIHLLEHGLFEKHFMDSRATTRAVSKKELVFGHLLGPLGLIFIVNTIAAAISTAANPVALFIKKSSFFIHCTLVYYHDKTVM